MDANGRTWSVELATAAAVFALIVGSCVVVGADQSRRALGSAPIAEKLVEIRLSGCLARPDGSYEITMDATNVGSREAVVVVPALVSGSTKWQAASVDVPPGDRRHLVVKGVSNPGDGDVPDSWSGGRILVNGSPYVIADTGDHWCG